MRDKEKAKNYNALYRRQHRFAIKLKNQMYRSLPHVKEQRRLYNQTPERKAYYKKNKQRLNKKNSDWAKNNPDRRKLHLQRYAERLRRRKKRKNMRSDIQRVISEFLEYCRERYDPETTRHYRMNMNRFLNYIMRHTTRCNEYRSRFYQESKKPEAEQDFSWAKEFFRIQYSQDLDRDFILRYVSFVNHDEINEERNLPLSQPEKESRLYPLKSFLWFCLRKGYVKKDLRKFIVVPSREKKILKRVLTQDEMVRFLEAPDTKTVMGARDRALFEISYSGFRAEEMLTLKIKHVDLVTNTVTILDAKGDKDRVVPMTSEAIYWIKIWLGKRQELIKDKPDPEFLFLTKGLKPIHRRNFSEFIKKYIQKAGILLMISPHDLRRTTATHLVENGAPIRLVQALLGHATLKVTTKYLRLSDEKIKQEHKETHPSNRRDLYYARVER